ncbi:hypothetical protein HG537_0H02340 [Torulaspora globosa]|uniref:Mitochondrial carrier n=1 Tax=Torulaspora globosa TaxID=48254 RepID=A0A7H9I113_9SACH|nr:hypothetical protein HG537_0H02340 [Torulaspora sp. CBS 2947]
MATLEAAFTGAVASSVANVVVYPLDLAKTLLQTQLRDRKDEEVKDDEYMGVVDCMWKVLKSSGLMGLYRGISTSIMGNFVQSFCYFFCYTFLRRYYYAMKVVRSKGQGKLVFSTAEELVLGIAAAAGSQLFTSPISVISTRQQTVKSRDSAISVAKQILEENHGDLRAFWKGLKVSLVLTVNPSITYASYQKLKKLLFSVDEFTEVGLTARQNFVLGALSKMISTLITQPLIVSKVSLQSAGSRFTNFQQVIHYLYKHEGVLALWKGLRPQLIKGLLVQGLLFMFKGELTKALRRLLFLYSNLLVTRNKRLLL